jgi:hypothetical protein
MNDFFPEGYEVPTKEGGYMKFEQGENRFRILCSPIMGYEWWVDEDGEVVAKGEKPKQGNKPVRAPMGQPVPVEAAETYRHFWAMVVWNYNAKKVQILQLTQGGIQKTIRALEKDKDWGSPMNYDLVVTRTGEGLETEYSVTPKPAKELDKAIGNAFTDANIDLEALFRGEDPFQSSGA